MKDDLLKGISGLEYLAASGKLRRLLHHPLKYIFAIGHRKLIYPFVKSERIVTTQLFWGRSMKIALPASTDIYLTGGKSHPSETRLARYLVRALSPDSVFFDVGAHYGYYTLLAAQLTRDGSVFSFEPSAKAFTLLQQNINGLRRVVGSNVAVAAAPGAITFHEFDNLHSEYNSATIGQFEGEAWFRGTRQRTVPAVSLDSFCAEQGVRPTHIKLDVEGFEQEVIRGAEAILSGTKRPVVIMEYLASARNNEAHREAHALLMQFGFTAHTITNDGTLTPVTDVENHLRSSGLDSDNIVFKSAV